MRSCKTGKHVYTSQLHIAFRRNTFFLDPGIFLSVLRATGILALRATVAKGMSAADFIATLLFCDTFILRLVVTTRRLLITDSMAS